MFLLICIILLFNPDGATGGALEGLKIAFETVIVSVLPFAVFSSALIYSGTTERIGKFLEPFFVKMGINPYGAIAFLMGALGGYPIGCKSVCDMYKKNLVDKEEAEKMLAYTNNGGIVFSLSVCGTIAFSSILSGGIIYAVALLSSLITAMVLSRSNKGKIEIYPNKKTPVMAIVGKSIASGGGVILNILASFIVIYAVIGAAGLDNLPIVAGLVELTKGIMYAGEMNNLPLAALFFSFGGMGVFTQCAAICAECDISLKKYLIGKIVSGCLAFSITYIIVHVNYSSKDIVLFSFFALIAIICALKLIKKQNSKC